MSCQSAPPQREAHPLRNKEELPLLSRQLFVVLLLPCARLVFAVRPSLLAAAACYVAAAASGSEQNCSPSLWCGDGDWRLMSKLLLTMILLLLLLLLVVVVVCCWLRCCCCCWWCCCCCVVAVCAAAGLRQSLVPACLLSAVVCCLSAVVCYLSPVVCGLSVACLRYVCGRR
jgi:hypothetical protein